MQISDLKDIIFLAVEDYFQTKNFKAETNIFIDKNDEDLHLVHVNTYYKGVNIFDEVFIKEVNRNYPLLQFINKEDFILIKPLVKDFMYQRVRHSSAATKRVKSFLKQSKIKFLSIGSYVLILKNDFISENTRFNFTYTNYAKKGYSIHQKQSEFEFDINTKKGFLIKMPHVEINRVFVSSKQTSRFFIYEENKIHIQNSSRFKHVNHELSNYLFQNTADLEYVPMIASLPSTHNVHIDDVPRLYGEKMIKVLVDQ